MSATAATGSDDARSRVEVAVKILGKEYRVACPEEERASLEGAARLLDTAMQEIRSGSRTVATERLAVIAALNVVAELSRSLDAAKAVGETSNASARSLLDRLDAALDAEARNG